METINSILKSVYGVTLENANASTILWAADKIEDTIEAKKALAKVNRKMEKMGKCPAYAPFGHRLF